MSALCYQLRPGAYCDSIVLLQVQKGLAGLPGVLDASAGMATETNLELLAAQGLLPAGLGELAPDDLLVVVRGESEQAALGALAELDSLLHRRASGGEEEDYRFKSLAAASRAQPHGRWVLISVPGRHAARLAAEALELGRNVFLFSDNVSLAEELELKREAAKRGLLVMGPDCGTAIVAGVGFGFANRVPRGGVGLVAASGTGLQMVASRLAALGSGVSQALGTGGRDLSAEVGGASTLLALDLLARDPRTRVIVLISKPPAPAVAARVLAAARATGKPTVVAFLGYVPPLRRLGQLWFASSLSEAAELAAGLDSADESAVAATEPAPGSLRALFSGGTLAYEALLGLLPFLGPISSNLEVEGSLPLPSLAESSGHTLLDLGEDAFTVGRLHPTIDQDLRLRRFRQEAADPATGLILLDFVLGDAAHPDPAAEWAPAIEQVRQGSGPEVVALVVGTEEDPQRLSSQVARLSEAGARVFSDSGEALAYLAERLAAPAQGPTRPVALEALGTPLTALNLGLETFAESLAAQGADVSHVEWRPPAGGNARLLAILDRLRR